MTESGQPPITSSSWIRDVRKASWKYPSGSPPAGTFLLPRPSRAGQAFGSVTVINPESRYDEGRKRAFVEVACVCGLTGWVDWPNLKSGKTPGCRPCAIRARRPYPEWLDRRMSVIQQRCQNPNNPGYPQYGGRGIQFGWSGLHEASLWVWENLGPFEREKTLDRIDTNGHYAPGNLRLADQKLQQSNKRTTVLSEFHQEHWPFSYGTTVRRLKRGMTREQIIEDAKEVVRTRGSHYPHVAEKLASMTSDLPDHIIVMPYRVA